MAIVISHKNGPYTLIYPDSFEKKIGFDAVRHALASHCGSQMGRVRVDTMAFSSDSGEVKKGVASDG